MTPPVSDAQTGQWPTLLIEMCLLTRQRIYYSLLACHAIYTASAPGCKSTIVLLTPVILFRCNLTLYIRNFPEPLEPPIKPEFADVSLVTLSSALNSGDVFAISKPFGYLCVHFVPSSLFRAQLEGLLIRHAPWRRAAAIPWR